ncbi:MAG: DUF2442 domain-containing protein [Deltaproteobacteria bacterium]|nr:DUF2442 domain-containing protein [Deltaproteobacteria bacterium]
MVKLGREIIRILDTNAESFSVKVEYDDGAIIDVRMGHIFDKPKGLATEILRGGMFDKCFLESGALAWPNGLELCPDAMRSWANSGKTPRARRRA